jgi:hypothetical protein
MDQSEKIKKQNHKMELMTQDELCAYLGKSKAWAERSRFEGTGPRFVRAGRKPLYPIEWITEWLLESASDNTVNV